jgi:IS5 family transposase
VLVVGGLTKVLFDTVTRQLRSEALMLKTGTQVDTKIIASASEANDDACWVKHTGKAAVHGFKAHVGADAETAFTEEVAVIPANVNDGTAGPEALPDDPGAVFADSAYCGDDFGHAVRDKSERRA